MNWFTYFLIFIFFSALLTLVLSGYYLYKSKGDKEGANIYRVFVVISFWIALYSGVELIPEEYLVQHSNTIRLFTTAVIILSTLSSLLQILRGKLEYKSRTAKIVNIGVLILILSVAIFLFYQYFLKFST